jgi:subtilase family serine protease
MNKKLPHLFLALALSVTFTSSVGASGVRVLRGHVPDIIGQFHLPVIGRLPAANRVHLVLMLPLRNEPALTNLLEQLYDPASINYHHYLTPQQFSEQFGPIEQDYQSVANFARTNKLDIIATHDSRLMLDVQGNVSDIERAFHVTLNTYQDPAEPRTFYAPDVEPSVDSSLPITRIEGITDYTRLRALGHVMRAANSTGVASGSAPGGYYWGTDFRNAYVPGSPLTGTGQIVGLFEADGYYSSDIASYESRAGLPSVPLTNVLIDGFPGTPGSGNSEVALDIEMAISMAPGLSSVTVFETTNLTADWLDVLDSMANQTQIKQFSSSWGYKGGANPNAAFDAVFQKMATQGQSFFQASGDGDAWTNPIWVPAASPYLTSVGGTTLTMNNSGASYSSETVWNSGYYKTADLSGSWFANGNGYWGSGGGVSTFYSIPYWQQGMNMTANHGSAANRNIPDVAMVADGVWVLYNNGGSDWFVGTSCAAPLWAGFIALVNQQAASYSVPTVGFINPAIYRIGGSASYASGFNDISTGNDFWPSSPTNFSAVPGYDLCTGWGTPNGTNLINLLAPQITPIFLTIAPSGAGKLQITESGLAFGITNYLQASTNPLSSAANWVSIATNIATNNEFIVNGLAPTNAPAKFYRVIERP